MFYPVGNQYLRAAGTYELGFYHITIGRWLAKKLKEEHCAKAAYFDFVQIKKYTFQIKIKIARKQFALYISQISRGGERR